LSARRPPNTSQADCDFVERFWIVYLGFHYLLNQTTGGFFHSVTVNKEIMEAYLHVHNNLGRPGLPNPWLPTVLMDRRTIPQLVKDVGVAVQISPSDAMAAASYRNAVSLASSAMIDSQNFKFSL
jgi:hypothetical protein